MENNDTLNEMREQMQVLKKKIENQKIVSNSMIQRSYRSGLRSLKVRSTRVTMLGIVGMALAFSFCKNGFSLAFFIATEVMLLICIIASMMINRNIPEMDADLITAAEKLAKFKKGYVDWIAVGIPMCIAWVVWMFTEVYLRDAFPEEFKKHFIFGISLGLLLGLTLGLRLRRGIIKSTEALLADLEDFKSSQED